MSNLDCILRPRSVAVVGASTNKGTLGREIFDKLLSYEFNGPVYPVNPKAKFIHSVRAYDRISAIPEAVDLAIIVVRKELVLDVVKECGESGVKGIVVITAGFKETGEQGAKLEKKLMETVEAFGLRMVGPNCMGVINTAADVRLDSTFVPVDALPGSIGLVSQSGALGQTILEYAHELNLGISMFVSVGNKADISGNDLLDYWRDDPSVQVILMYLESFGDPRGFLARAKEVSLKKPIIVVKSGRTSSGARAATSHTGALAGLDVAYDALFKQCGILRANSINEMFDFALGFSSLPLPGGNRVAIITNAGGPGIMAADACEGLGLEVVALAAETQAGLKAALVPDASVGNPVDLLAGATPGDYNLALKIVLGDVSVDAAIVIFVAPIVTDPLAVATNISSVVENFEKPVLGCFMGVKGVATGVAELHRRDIPAYPFPESAARALAAMVAYSEWRSKPLAQGTAPVFETAGVSQIIEMARSKGREHLLFSELLDILQAYEIPFCQSSICHSGEEVIRAATEIGFPVVLKVSSQGLIHKSEVGGVHVNVQNNDDLGVAFNKMVDELQQRKLLRSDTSFIVQEMIHAGREIIMGLHASGDFGTLIMVGLGGVYVEAMQDVVFRLAPLTAVEADEMIGEIRGLPILQGIRGEAAVDFDVLRSTLLKLSALATDFPEIVELEINPFLAFPEAGRCKGVDARARITL